MEKVVLAAEFAVLAGEEVVLTTIFKRALRKYDLAVLLALEDLG